MSSDAVPTDAAALTMNYPGFVFRSLRRLGVSEMEIVKGSGLQPEDFEDPEFRCAFWQHRRLILNALSLTGDAQLGFRLARDFETSMAGLPAFAAKSCRRFEDALAVTERYFGLTFPILASERRDTEQEVVIVFRSSYVLGEIAHFVFSSAAVVCWKLFSEFTQPEPLEFRAEFRQLAPPPDRRLDVGFPISFAATRDCVAFPRRFLSRPLASADPINHGRLLALCEDMKTAEQSKPELADQVVEFLLENNLNTTLDEAARALGLSARSLRRRLGQSGVTFRELRDQAGERLAREMLGDPHLSIQTIAYELGFNEPSNFARSFKRWTGLSPREFRERLPR